MTYMMKYDTQEWILYKLINICEERMNFHCQNTDTEHSKQTKIYYNLEYWYIKYLTGVMERKMTKKNLFFLMRTF
jgi:hypothetical protein